MAQIHWANPISGGFTNTADWKGGVVPGPADDAILDAAGKAFTVTANASETVRSVQTAANATLAVTGGTFTAATATGSGANAGLITVAGGASLDLGGTFDDAGKTVVRAGGSLMAAAGGLSLIGGGIVELGQSAASRITGATTSATLTNADVIEGGGQLGAGSLTLVNQAAGIIADVGKVALTIDTGANTIANAGVILSSGAGGLTIAGAVDNSGHLAVNGGALEVKGAVTGSGYGEVVTGTLKLDQAFNQNVLFTNGSTGTLELAQGQAYTAGRITGLSNRGANSIVLDDIAYVAGVTTWGLIDQTQTSAILTITDGTHTAAITLAGFPDYNFAAGSGPGGVGTQIIGGAGYDARQVSGDFNATADWSLGVPNSLDDAVMGGGATITASTSETVNLIQNDDATLAITGGVFTATGGTDDSLGGSSYNLDQITVGDGATLRLGDVLEQGRGGGALLSLASGATLQVVARGLAISGGLVLMSQTGVSTIAGARSSATLTNGSEIEGGGRLGGGSMILINGSTTGQRGGKPLAIIAAEGPLQLTIDTGANTIVNRQLIFSQGTGGMIIKSTIDNLGTLEVDGGTLEVAGADVGLASTGDGVVVVKGLLKFDQAFNQDVDFTSGSTGTLELAQSLGYTQGAIAGLSTTAANALSFDDIAFIQGKTTATYSGNAGGGVLTVTDGTHTAKVNLVGDYVGHTFTTNLGVGGVGTKIVDPSGPAAASAVHVASMESFVAAMAAFGAGSAGAPVHAAATHAETLHTRLVTPAPLPAAR